MSSIVHHVNLKCFRAIGLVFLMCFLSYDLRLWRLGTQAAATPDEPYADCHRAGGRQRLCGPAI